MGFNAVIDGQYNMDDTVIDKSKKKEGKTLPAGKIQILFSVITEEQIEEEQPDGSSHKVDVSIETFYIGGHIKKPIQVFQRKMKRLKYGGYKKNIIQHLTIYDLLNLEFNNEISPSHFGIISDAGTEIDPCYGYLQNKGNGKWIASFQYSNVNAQITENLWKNTVLNSDWNILYISSQKNEVKVNWKYTECKSALYKGSSGFLKMPYFFDEKVVQDFTTLYSLPNDKQPKPNKAYKGKCFFDTLIQSYTNEFTPTGENKDEWTTFYTGRTEISLETINSGNYNDIEYDPKTGKYYISGSGVVSSRTHIYYENTESKINLEMKDSALFFTPSEIKSDDFMLTNYRLSTVHHYFYGDFSYDGYGNPNIFSGVIEKTFNSTSIEKKSLTGNITAVPFDELMNQYKTIYEASTQSSLQFNAYKPDTNSSKDSEQKTVITQTIEMIYYGGRGGIGEKQEGGIKKISGYNELTYNDSALEINTTKKEAWTDYYIKSNLSEYNSLKFREESFSGLNETSNIKPLLDDIDNSCTQVDITFYKVLFNPNTSLGSEKIWKEDANLEVAKYEYNKKESKYIKNKEHYKVFSLGYTDKNKPTACMIHAYSFHP